MSSRRTHLHRLDHPLTLAILGRLLNHRVNPPAGYERTDEGAWVDWDALCASYLSSTEVAAVHVARGCVGAERHGGFPADVRAPLRQAIKELTAQAGAGLS